MSNQFGFKTNSNNELLVVQGGESGEVINQDNISRGLVSGASQFNKFGYRTASTAAGGEETIWATNTNLTILTTASTFTIAYNNATDGSGQTGATLLQIYYLDANEKLQNTAVVLGSSGSDVTAFTGLGINRAVVVGSGSNNTNVNDITITATTGGSTQAIIPAGTGITQQCFFFCPDDSVSVVKWLELNANDDAGGSPPVIRFKGYVYNRTVDSYFEIFRYIMDTALEEEKSFYDPCNFPLSPRDVVYFVMDTDRNNTEVNVRFSLNLYQNA